MKTQPRTTEIKFRHPKDHSLTWTGKGKQPAWVAQWVTAVGPLEALEVAYQEQQIKQQESDTEIDLGIGDATALAVEPTMAESLYAQRIVAGVTPKPAADEPTYSEGTKTAVARLRDEAEAKPVSGEVTMGQPATEQEGRDLINQLLGQAQAFSAASRLIRTFGVSKLAYVKENGLYKGLAGMRIPNGSELRGTWEDFCGLLGISVDKADADIANLRAFGEEALESMSRMGIGYRELRQFRKLPPDQREALAVIAKTGDRDDLLEAAYDAIEKERSAALELQVKNAELSEDLKASERRTKNLDAECERKDHQLKRLTDAKKRLTEFEERTEEVRAECVALQREAELPIDGLRQLFEREREFWVDSDEAGLRVDHIWLAVNAIAARALDLIGMMRGSAPVPLPERVLGEHILTPAEAEAWLQTSALLLNEYEARKAQRQEAREAEQPHKRGRPKGSKNKAEA